MEAIKQPSCLPDKHVRPIVLLCAYCRTIPCLILLNTESYGFDTISHLKQEYTNMYKNKLFDLKKEWFSFSIK